MRSWIAILSVVLLSACAEENLRMIFTESQCSDPWIYVEANTTEEKVVEYLGEMGIKVYKIEMEQYSDGPFCLACSCPSGNYIYIVVDKKDQEALEELGFRES